MTIQCAQCAPPQRSKTQMVVKLKSSALNVLLDLEINS